MIFEAKLRWETEKGKKRKITKSTRKVATDACCHIKKYQVERICSVLYYTLMALVKQYFLSNQA